MKKIIIYIEVREYLDIIKGYYSNQNESDIYSNNSIYIYALHF